ncbi:MAG: lysine--tRNA ligase [Thermoguttaceae bacterium]|nr:lysine--tRNA ligase [Thermoguttaceae bacterium]MDW8077331.1 lysine--tRNA ligase [Thermoguttaceae bacterium]
MTPEGTSLAALEAARRQKLERIRQLGHDPFGQRFDGRLSIGQIRQLESSIVKVQSSDGAGGQELIERGPRVRAAGRILLQRRAGKIVFLDIWDWTGKIQVLIGKQQVGEANWALAECFDLGDIIGVDGELKHTKTGELTIFAENLYILTKALAPPPAKHKGLTDPDLRQRLRYLDLIHTEGVLERFLMRSRIIDSIRATLAREGFVEVEGPTLHTVAGGAAARPFVTYHNALGIELYLRIALELHLKRLLVGGFEKVYELGRVYRNEGISPRHNPEFTMLEAYQAYGDYHTMMDLTEQIIVDAIAATGQSLELPWGETVIDFTPPFARRTYHELLAEHLGIDPLDEAAVRRCAAERGIPPEGKHIDVVKNELFEEFVQAKLAGPIFVLDYPAGICPLTKRKRDDPTIAERFELFVQGMEIANAYTELNDPDLQEELFSRQLEGLPEEESMARMDRDFIRALRHGMPPAGGLGIGIDRLVMLLTNCQSIREVILFPLLRPEPADVHPDGASSPKLSGSES